MCADRAYVHDGSALTGGALHVDLAAVAAQVSRAERRAAFVV